jgi:hypothetical protein
MYYIIQYLRLQEAARNNAEALLSQVQTDKPIKTNNYIKQSNIEIMLRRHTNSLKGSCVFFMIRLM